jgi:shikimate kinase
VPDLVVLAGPIGSGKSTVAELLARRCASSGRSAAIADLDDVAFAQRGVLGVPELWRRAGVAHAGVVRGWFAAGTDVVIAHGPFFEARSYEALFASAGAGSRTSHVLLTVPFEVALGRVTADPDRRPTARSRDPDFLRSTHEVFAGLDLPAADFTFDTTTMSPAEIVERLAGHLGFE